MVSDNDGSAFITKAEFDSLKNNFQSQIDNYNSSIDSKIDGAIASYLAGIKLSTTTTFETIYWNYNPSGLTGGTLLWSSKSDGTYNGIKKDNYGINVAQLNSAQTTNVTGTRKWNKCNIVMDYYVNDRLQINGDLASPIGIDIRLLGGSQCWYGDMTTAEITFTNQTATGYLSFMKASGGADLWLYILGDYNAGDTAFITVDGVNYYTRSAAATAIYKINGESRGYGSTYRGAFGDTGLYNVTMTILSPSKKDTTLYPLSSGQEFCYQDTVTDVQLVLASREKNKHGTKTNRTINSWSQTSENIATYAGAYNDDRELKLQWPSASQMWNDDAGAKSNTGIALTYCYGYTAVGDCFADLGHTAKTHRDLRFAQLESVDSKNSNIYKGLVLGTAAETGTLSLDIKVDLDGHIILYAADNADALWGGASNYEHGGRATPTDWSGWSSNPNTTITANVTKTFTIDVIKNQKIFFLYLPTSDLVKGKVLSVTGTLTTEN